MLIVPGGVGRLGRRSLASASALAVSYLAQGNAGGDNQTTYTFLTQPLGAAAGASERRFYVVGIWSEIDSAQTISSVTVRGQSGSQIAFVGATELLSLWLVEDTSANTTGTLAITFSALMTDCGFALWRITSGLGGIALVDFATNTGTNGPVTVSAALDVAANGVQIAYAKYSKLTTIRAKRHTGAHRTITASVGDYSTSFTSDDTPNAVWTDLTEAFDADVQSFGFVGLGAFLVTASWRPVT